MHKTSMLRETHSLSGMSLPHIHTQTRLCIQTQKERLGLQLPKLFFFFFFLAEMPINWKTLEPQKDTIAGKGRGEKRSEYLHCDTIPGNSRVQNTVSHCEKQIIKADSLNHLPLVRTQAKHPRPIAANKRLPICNAANTVSNIFVSRCHCDEKSRRQSACNYCVNPIGVTHFILEHITEFFNSWPDY